MKYKHVLNIRMANKLLWAGFIPVEFTLSRSFRGRVAFVFEETDELIQAMTDLSKRNND